MLMSCFLTNVCVCVCVCSLCVCNVYGAHGRPSFACMVPCRTGLPKKKFFELILLCFTVLSFALMASILIGLFGACHLFTRLYGRLLGLLSSIFTMCQWIPQIQLTLSIRVREYVAAGSGRQWES